MQAAAGVGEHGQAVELVPARIFGHPKGPVFFPVTLGGGFNLFVLAAVVLILAGGVVASLAAARRDVRADTA